MVYDESIGGFAVGGINVLVLKFNHPVRINADGLDSWGYCRQAGRDKQGNIRIGIKRDIEFLTADDFFEATHEQETGQFLIQPFLRMDEDIELVCAPVTLTESGDLIIELPNRKRLTVPPNSITPMVLADRVKQLLNPGLLQNIQSIYRRILPRLKLDSSASVVDLEFGIQEVALHARVGV